MWAHFCSFGLLVLAVFWPLWFVYPAGLALIVANIWLLRNLLSAVAVYRSHAAKIKVLAAEKLRAISQ
jgi:flagellar biogenesis protein FliO